MEDIDIDDELENDADSEVSLTDEGEDDVCSACRGAGCGNCCDEDWW
jgi:hypothetical protein